LLSAFGCQLSAKFWINGKLFEKLLDIFRKKPKAHCREPTAIIINVNVSKKKQQNVSVLKVYSNKILCEINMPFGGQES
jgi:hypothetical protein